MRKRFEDEVDPRELSPREFRKAWKSVKDPGPDVGFWLLLAAIVLVGAGLAGIWWVLR